MTIKYKTKSFLQMIGRVPVAQEEVVKAKRGRAESLVITKKIKVEKEVKVEGELLKIVDGVIVID